MNNSLKIHTGIALTVLLLASLSTNVLAQQCTTDVEITGKIVFTNPTDHNDYGLYSNYVYLFFNNTNNPNADPKQLDNTDDTHERSYDILEEDGSFTFDFCTDEDLSIYNQVLVWPATQNAAAIIKPDENGGGGDGCGDVDPPFGDECANKIATQPGGSSPQNMIFFDENTSAKVAINGSSSSINVTTNDGEVSPSRGIAFRGLMLAREYLLERYGSSPGYGVPKLRLKFDLGINDDEGQFRPNEYPVEASFKPSDLTLATVAHEYGHYINYRMWNADPSRFDNPDSDEQGLIEGWGQFYSFAVRNYAGGTYGDPLEELEDNLEEGPFRTTPYSAIGYYLENIKVPKAASYLWNVYDGTQMGAFKDSRYGNADNDDVGGDPLRVFTVMENINDNNKTLADFHSDFKSGRSQALKNSLDDIKNFTDDPDNDNMRPVPAKNLSGQVVGSSSIQFSWDSQAYGSGENYRNDSGAYHKLFIDDGSGWQLLKNQISFDNTTYTHNFGGNIEAASYKLETYNSAGVALGAPGYFLGVTAPTGLTITNPNAIFGGPRLDWHDNTGSVDWYLIFIHSDGISYPGWHKIDSVSVSEYVDVNVTLSEEVETFYYYVKAKKDGLVSTQSNTVSIEGEDASPFKRAGDGESTTQEALPTVYGMGANYPNPFNPTTVLAYDLPEAAQVSLEVYNVLGRKVQTLVSTVQAAGSYEASFNASRLSNGVYIARLKAKGQSGKTFVQEQKMTLIK